MGKRVEHQKRLLPPTEDCLFERPWSFSEAEERMPDVALFPEIEWGCMEGENADAVNKRLPDVALFPECVDGETILELSLPQNVFSSSSAPMGFSEFATALGAGSVSSSSKRWIFQASLDSILVCSECLLARFGFFSTVPDFAWKMEASSLWDRLQQVVGLWVAGEIPCSLLDWNGLFVPSPLPRSVGLVDSVSAFPVGFNLELSISSSLGEAAVEFGPSPCTSLGSNLKPRGRGRPRKLVQRDDSSFHDDGVVPRVGSFVPRNRGRPRKQSNRGRKKKVLDSEVSSVSSLSGESEIPSSFSDNPLILPEAEDSDGVLTRAKRALIVSKKVGVVFQCSDEVVLQGLIKQIASHKVS